MEMGGGGDRLILRKSEQFRKGRGRTEKRNEITVTRCWRWATKIASSRAQTHTKWWVLKVFSARKRGRTETIE